MNLLGKLLKCPQCGGELALADVNVAQDAAVCRACRYAGPFLNALVVPELTDEQLARPPRRVKLQRGFGDALTLTVRPRRWALLFLVPFTAIWSGGSMAGIYGSQLWRGEFDPKLSLFGLPFLLGTLGLLTAILYMIFGRTAVTLAKGRVEVRSGLFGLGRTRVLACGPDTTVGVAMSNFRVNRVPQPEIVVTSGGQTFKFGAVAFSKEELLYVAAVLRRAAGGG